MKSKTRNVTVKIVVDVDEDGTWTQDEIQITVPALAHAAVDYNVVVNSLYQRVCSRLSELIHEKERKEYSEKYIDDPAG